MAVQGFRTAALGTGITVAILVFTKLLLPGGPDGGGTPAAILFSGAVLGLLNGLVAAGIVLIYRSARIINFSQAAMGSLGGLFVFYLVQLNGWPFWVAFLFGLAVSALVGLMIDLALIRRFFFAPRLAVTVLTIALANLIAELGPIVPTLPIFPEDLSQVDLNRALKLPFPGFKFRIGDLARDFGFGYILAIVLSLLALGGLAYFLRFTRSGTAVRAYSENAERAELLGINVKSLSTLVWTIAATLSGLGVILTGTVVQFGSVQGLAPVALLPALAAAVLGRMKNIGAAVAAATGISVVTEALKWSFPRLGPVVYPGLFLVILIGLFIQRRQFDRGEATDASNWRATDEIRPTPKQLTEVGGIRSWRTVLIVLGAAVVLVYPWLTTIGAIHFGGSIALYGIVLLSLVVLTGWAGQVSLGQFAFVAVGAVIGGSMTSRSGIPFWVALPLSALITAGVATLIGIPALRVKGLFLGVVTFAFAVAVQSALFQEEYFGWLLPRSIERPTLFLLDFEDERSAYYLAVVALALCVLVVYTLRRYSAGRALIGIRENEANMRSFAVKVVTAKLSAFALSGFLCGLAGTLIAHHQRAVSASSFGAQASLDVFLLAVVGGITSVSGTILGALYFALRTSWTGDLAFWAGPVGILTVLYLFPGGLASMMYSFRDSIYRIVAQRKHIVVPSLMADYDPTAIERQLIPIRSSEPDSQLGSLIASERYQPLTPMYAARGRLLATVGAGETKRTQEAAAFGAATEGLEDATGADRGEE